MKDAGQLRSAVSPTFLLSFLAAESLRQGSFIFYFHLIFYKQDFTHMSDSKNMLSNFQPLFAAAECMTTLLGCWDEETETVDYAGRLDGIGRGFSRDF